MKLLLSFIILAVLLAGCTQTQPPINNTNNSNITVPPTNNSNSSIPPGYEVTDYCQVDSDCVRLNSCCDCGFGTYVNIYNQQAQCIRKPRCMCPIALSKGVCINNKCAAKAAGIIEQNQTTAQTVSLTFHADPGMCSNEIAPQRQDSGNQISLNGSMGAPNVCRTLEANLSLEGNNFILRIDSRAIPGVAACIDCVGSIPWQANITGYTGPINVQYDGRDVAVNNTQTTIPPGYEVKNYCQFDRDCIKQESCCDCGLGNYVNIYNHQNVSCVGKMMCMCASLPSRGACQNNTCVSVPIHGYNYPS